MRRAIVRERVREHGFVPRKPVIVDQMDHLSRPIQRRIQTNIARLHGQELGRRTGLRRRLRGNVAPLHHRIEFILRIRFHGYGIGQRFFIGFSTTVTQQQSGVTVTLCVVLTPALG